MGVGLAIGGLGAVAGIGGALISSSAAKSAANTQVAAENRAADLQLQEQNQVRGDLAPYNTTGQAATKELSSFVDGTGDPTAELKTLESTPGYQFDLSQGLKSVQNSAAARGLGTSGAALKGAAGFATGLAQNTYQANLLNPLQSLASLGENAAAQTGQFGTAGTANAGQAIVGAGNAGAAGTVGSANAIAGGLNSGASAPLNYLLYNKLLGTGGATSGSGDFYAPPGMSNTAATGDSWGAWPVA